MNQQKSKRSRDLPEPDRDAYNPSSNEGRRILEFKDETDSVDCLGTATGGVTDSRMTNIYEYTLKSYKMNESESKYSQSNTHQKKNQNNNKLVFYCDEIMNSRDDRGPY